MPKFWRRHRRITIAAISSLFVSAVLGPRLAVAAENGPIVVVVHGIGGPRSDGWSKGIQAEWGVANVQEVTFDYQGRNWRSGLTDFSRSGGAWALTVQRRLRQIARRNPGRPLVIVAHSWGSVATKVALSGGQAGLAVVDPLRGLRVARLVTLGSPLGLAPNSASGGVLGKLGVRVTPGRPPSVGQWVNVYDQRDPVAKSSWQLHGAINKGVSGSGRYADASGVSHHTGIWTHPWVTAFVRRAHRDLGGDRPAPPAAKAPIDQGRIIARLSRLSPPRLHQTLRSSGVSSTKLRCLCAQHPHGSMSVAYTPGPSGGSPACREAARGPCVYQGFGCTRRPLPTSAAALRACEIDRAMALRLGEARRAAGQRQPWAGSERRQPRGFRVAGSYRLGSFVVTFRQVGNRVFGSYRGGKSSMNGVLQGRTLIGTFRYNRRVHGTFRYTFNADGSAFVGPWKNSTDQRRGTDHGRRID